jgi:hypothetical protein
VATERWHIQLTEEAGPSSLVAWQPQRPSLELEEDPEEEAPPHILPLLAALRHLAFRAGDPGAWATPLADDPIAFLLDAMNEAVNVWTIGGELVCSNRAGAELELEGPGQPGVSWFARGARRFERRSLAFEAYSTTYIVEIVRQIS